MSSKRLTVEDKQRVIDRAGDRCEYCKSLRKYSPQPFAIEHILPLALGGETLLENLALSCGGCNGHKYIKIEALDPVTGLMALLFHPRKDEWGEHFEWEAGYKRVIGTTPTGRATVRALHLNRPELINLRAITLLTKEHPPE